VPNEKQATKEKTKKNEKKIGKNPEKKKIKKITQPEVKTQRPNAPNGTLSHDLV